MVFPPNTAHGFRVTGDAPLVTYGVHSSSDRIVDIEKIVPGPAVANCKRRFYTAR